MGKIRNFLLGSALALSSGIALAETNLINGQAADLRDFPASVDVRINGAGCTGTLIGERTMLIAAHCAANNSTATFSVGPNRFTSKCLQNAGFRNGDETADWSLCLVDRIVTGVAFEKVAVNANVCAANRKLLLTGFGCINSNNGNGSGGNDGIYRVGESTIQSCPSNTNDITTKNGAALCFGDSGGPAFLVAQDGSRQVVSVNSRGNIKDTSFLSALFTNAAKTFIKQFQQQTGQKICGIDADARGCREVDNGGGNNGGGNGGGANQCRAEATAALDLSARLTAALRNLDDCLAL